MKILSLVFVLSLLLPLVNSCFNNPRFTYFYAGMYRNCQNIRIENLRREEMCSRFQPVWENCPQSCGLCCLNDPNYRFRTRKNTPKDKTCEWIAEQSDETKARLCKKWSSGRMIRDACPLSCDFCQPAVLQKPPSPAPFGLSPPPTPSPTKAPTTSPTAAPTKSPTQAPTKTPTKSPTLRPTRPPRSGMPTPSPTAAPTKSPTKAPSKPPTAMPTYSSSAPTYVCLNDENYFAASNPQATCFWIGEDERRRQNFCTNEETVIACPQICGICCRDDRRFSFQTYINTTKRCGWVRAEKIRQHRYCEERRNGRLVKSACPVACGFCFDPIEQ